MSARSKLEELLDDDLSDGAMIAYAILDLADAIRGGLGNYDKEPAFLEAIAMALGFRQPGGTVAENLGYRRDDAD